LIVKGRTARTPGNVVVVETLSEKHKPQWDRFVETSRDATFFHTYEWDRLLRIGFRDETPFHSGLWLDNELAAIWPASIVPSLGGRVLSSAPHSPCGIPVLKGDLDIALLGRLVEHVLEVGRKKGLMRWQVDLPKDSTAVAFASAWGFGIQASRICTFVVDTTRGADVLWKDMAQQARTAVRKARKCMLRVNECFDATGISKYIHMYRSTMRRHGRQGVSSEFFDLLLPLVHRGKARLLLASVGDKAIAGIILFVHNQRAFYWSGASLQEAWKFRPNELLLWEAMEWASNSGIISLDLGPTPSEPTSSLGLFKRHLGGKRTDMVRLTLPINRLANLFPTSAVRLYRMVIKLGLSPRPLTRWLQNKYDTV